MKAKDFAIGILIEDYRSGLRTKTETTAEILALFNVSNCDNCGKDKKLTHCQECYDYEEYKEN